MFSYKSLTNFALVNGLISGISYLSNVGYRTIFSNMPFLGLFGMEFAKNVFMIKFMDYFTASKSLIRNNEKDKPKESFKGEFLLNTACSSLVKSTTHYAIINYTNCIISGSETFMSQDPFINFGIFVVKSFAFELSFDFCHYWLHRLLHSRMLYKYIHKKHHKFSYPSAEMSFYMSPIDVGLSYSVPLAISLFFVKFSHYDFILLTTYLTYQEIGGHLGKIMYPTSCFAQCVWLPRMFQIELYTEDHNIHHTKFKYNYSKRFMIWDKLFGTKFLKKD